MVRSLLGTGRRRARVDVKEEEEEEEEEGRCLNWLEEEDEVLS
jgi:hypothetical protein